ncbi:hypothetical protein BIY37_08640 [Candidatus Brocadia sapporoensis]|uniref:DUF262 domain-containing protein n=1 Tax=Candidatus Brocadia sapporoensis TaxID=392547 RepID=A0A1V6LZ14_9BACT|nr:DUF262 domain-containing protein [Candidatus Brocadia sapporoensis]MDG6005293.1 DUF262 domain-containing protein [Candidatus Brocadia sp.]OQD45414.1 hypothetical protein BIY37_08640 [Candidatus Brocadia sapporoensis]GJQ22263.1 MAG: hypothetical protein HBSAPP01_00530 [Candidatus Brocadia sapporoensis]
MQAKETKLQDIIEGTKQYVIPLFRRTYSWEEKEWKILWEDLVELCTAENPRSHFIGSIVNMPTVSVPEGVAKFLLIDGQQRLTTIFILLTLLRNKAKEKPNQEFAEEINNTLLVNPYKKGNDYFKLMPTQVDRDAYINLINGKSNGSENQLTRAYTFFEKRLRQTQFEHEKLKKIITSYFSVVSIVLDADDNPYLVFESLNAKGMPLTQADLIRNYFFMRIHADKQDEVYNNYWQPMQTALNDRLTEYIRHFLMKDDGSIIKQSDVYFALKGRVSPDTAIDYLKKLQKFSIYYQRLIYPEFEPEVDLQKHFRRVDRIEVTTAYPLLLNVYDNYVENKISKADFISILKTLENYLIRRFVCNVPTNQLNKIFSAVYPQLTTKYSDNLAEGVKAILQSKGYPKDNEFCFRFKEAKFYGGGDRQKKTKLILESLEESFAHKEAISFDNLSIEHVMPQTLSEWWQNHLGNDWEETHALFLHTIGNLTLSAYNTELSNDDFIAKKRTYNESHLERNEYFYALSAWTRAEIEERAKVLAKQALEIWNYFGQEKAISSNLKEVTGTTPTELKILGQRFPVQTWRDVLEQTLNTVADLETDKFEIIAHSFPHYVGKDKNKFRASRQLQNGYFVEVNMSAQSIQRRCRQLIETIDLTSEDWSVETI